MGVHSSPEKAIGLNPLFEKWGLLETYKLLGFETAPFSVLTILHRPPHYDGKTKKGVPVAIKRYVLIAGTTLL